MVVCRKAIIKRNCVNFTRLPTSRSTAAPSYSRLAFIFAALSQPTLSSRTNVGPSRRWTHSGVERGRRWANVDRRRWLLHDLLVAVPAAPARQPRLQPALHSLGGPRPRRFQTGRLESGFAPVGRTQEQAGYELRNDGPSTQVRFSLCFFFFRFQLKFAFQSVSANASER